MDRLALIPLVLLLLSVFCSDLYDFFVTTEPPKPLNPPYYPLLNHDHRHRSNLTNLNRTYPATLNPTQLAGLNQTQLASLNQTQIASLNQEQLGSLSPKQLASLNRSLSPTQLASLNQTELVSLNRTVNDTILIKFASLCSYRGTSMSIKVMVMEEFPAINVTLSHHPQARPKYIASKIISTAQLLIIIIVMAGKHICLELKRPIPSWHYRLAAHKFFVIAIPWLLGCIAINYLQNTETFEMFFNGDLVFCKQMEGRFPKAEEVRDIIRSQLDGLWL